MGSTRAKVHTIPNCDLCLDRTGTEVKAYADARMQLGHMAGHWAYLCTRHFQELGCSLGTGQGQELYTKMPNNPKDTK